MKTTTRPQILRSLQEFTADRQAHPQNAEQKEAFVTEYYLIVSQIVRDSMFSLTSEQTFPILFWSTYSLPFNEWIPAYEAWKLTLFDFEKDLLANARVSWE